MNHITQFLISYGGMFLFLVGFAEQSGLPFPGAPWLLAAGALAASGRFSLIAAVCWAAAGCLAADAIWFHLGHRGKSRVFRVFPHLHAVRSRLQQTTLTGSILHGARMLTAAKFLPFGSVVPLHAGALEVGSLRFLLVDAFTSVFYAAAYAFLGFVFHKQLGQVVAFLRKLGAVSSLLIVVLAGTYVVHWFFKHHPKREARPEPEKSKAEGTICVTCS
ncbi:MAG TPA: hypothetical protein VNZ64_15800 [Candidatus Acidoferrum sp.]|jgi:membrane protein DedA with SNARE-associated domain|nr:hypothetical protein [Candidatus Acidoferrum sp.]